MNALTIVHDTIKKYVKEGDICIDATAGRGHDTAFLAKIVGKGGSVTAFDIQQEALDSTAKLLQSQGLKATLILDSHANMAKYAAENSVDCIIFNLGYLPHGNHKINTCFESTKTAVEEGMKLLKKGGIMCVTIYYGGDSGYAEKESLLPWLSTVDDSEYQVLVTQFHNWKNDPPIPVIILKI